MNKETIVKNNLWKIENAVSDALCDFLINHAENSNKKNDEEWKFKECKFGKSIDKEYRNSWEIHIVNKDIQKLFWETIKPYIPKLFQGRKLIGAHYSTFYLLRYKPGEKFEMHRDGHSTNSKGQKSFITALLYLNNCEEGGETRFFEEPYHGINFEGCSGVLDISTAKGSLILMRHFILHQSMPVIKGIKYALRFNILYESFGEWYYGPPLIKSDEETQKFRSFEVPRVYFFLPMNLDSSLIKKGRLPREGEDRCEQCYEILNLKYDYYECPGCNAPVVCTLRNPFVTIENSTIF
jgi:hypothetical protein